MALEKEFTEEKVQRMRNLIQGKYHDATTITSGYSKKEVDHKEGEVWEEDGKKWTIKDGLKQNVTRLDSAKESYLTPLFCPSCSKIMKKKNDPTFYSIHGKCFDCVVVMEHELRKEGKWEDYQKRIKNDQIDNMIIEFKSFIEEKRYETNKGFATENGDIENWVGSIDQERVDKHLKEGIEYLQSLKQE
mgnify:CR=1 FL=1